MVPTTISSSVGFDVQSLRTAAQRSSSTEKATFGLFHACPVRTQSSSLRPVSTPSRRHVYLLRASPLARARHRIDQHRPSLVAQLGIRSDASVSGLPSLVDGDLRPRCHHRFRASHHTGLALLLSRCGNPDSRRSAILSAGHRLAPGSLARKLAKAHRELSHSDSSSSFLY